MAGGVSVDAPLATAWIVILRALKSPAVTVVSEFFSAFIPQLLATVVGAAIGLIGVLWVSRTERRAVSRDQFDQAVERLLVRLNELATSADQWQKLANRSLYRTPSDWPPPHPFPGGVSIALEVVRLKAPPVDLETIAQLSEAWDEVAQASGGALSAACGVFAGAITAWRNGEPSADVAGALGRARTMSRSTGAADGSPSAD